MPTFRLANDPAAQERLGNVVGHLPVEVETEGGRIIKVERMPAWTSFVLVLVANPVKAVVVTNQDEVTALREWLAQHAPGSVVEE